jgi:hypothetical protein
MAARLPVKSNPREVPACENSEGRKINDVMEDGNK